MRKIGWVAAVGALFVAIVALVWALAVSLPVEGSAAVARAPDEAPARVGEVEPTVVAEPRSDSQVMTGATQMAPSTAMPGASDAAAAPDPASAASSAREAQVDATSLAPTPAPQIAAAAPEPEEPSPTPVPPSAAPAYAEHQVGAGDTLLSIALARGVSMASIQLANEMGESQIVRLGQTLRVPTAKRSPDESVFWTLHAVQAGETLSTIGADYSVSVDALAAANGLADAGLIGVDQMLIIPVDQLLAARPEPQPVAAVSPSQPTAKPAAAAPETEAPAGVAVAPTPVPLPAVEAAAADTAQALTAQTPAGGDTGAFAMRLLELYNQARAEAGLAALQWSPALQQAAQGHANDSASRGYGSHVGSDGATARTRIARVGYSGRVTGENWAFASSADRAFNMWFHQEYPDGPHRRNILSPRYAEVGFGIADAGNGGYYVIANFGAP